MLRRVLEPILLILAALLASLLIMLGLGWLSAGCGGDPFVAGATVDPPDSAVDAHSEAGGRPDADGGGAVEAGEGGPGVDSSAADAPAGDDASDAGDPPDAGGPDACWPPIDCPNSSLRCVYPQVCNYDPGPQNFRCEACHGAGSDCTHNGNICCCGLTCRQTGPGVDECQP